MIKLDGRSTRLDILEKAGSYEPTVENMTPYTTKAHCIMFTCALNNRISLEFIESFWIPIVKQVLNRDSYSCILVANKKDLDRTISEQELQEFANMHRIKQVIETSALTTENLEYAFLQAARMGREALHGLHEVYEKLERREPVMFVEPKQGRSRMISTKKLYRCTLV